MAEALMITRRELRQQAMRQGVALGALEAEGACDNLIGGDVTGIGNVISANGYKGDRL